MFHSLEVCCAVTPDGVTVVRVLADSLLDSSVVVDLRAQEEVVPVVVPPAPRPWGPTLGIA